MVVGKRPRSRSTGLIGALLRLVAIVALAWVAGLLWFSLTLPGAAPLATRTDAVVVLTGGKGRLARGVEVLQAGAAPRMLISGVARSSSMAMIAEAAELPMSAFATTDLGYGAVDTRSNAEETASWVTRREVRSLRLVTSSAHMRRARLELSRAVAADVRVVPDAVPHEVGAPGIPWEYTKFLARWLALNAGLG
ncbi:hypothetical protein GCM10007973_04930 [Polymorphobacter multimanifer]|uniref:Uncharacterized SAM-binding protein YcdF (DUF218 family) n=2 Tax=Polymorphobacter multimanifer TaxID=1070431 RepID=A0A841L5Z9_9SPHN|nr:YdcF family protein [Polymorphobacter multimanifer]MBB6227676.1 uncharacterized SAM-binding protein YcdF (DUF218 family) [Polymorphobacter multimanifer]GGI70941.1 hypothetical protein GCM10007973_04930 [Polymorphobacter multimanifer]